MGHYCSSTKTEMKTQQQLKNEITDLEAQLNCLREQYQKVFLPENFNITAATESLDDRKSLCSAFEWDTTPQGREYWEARYEGIFPLDSTDVMQIQKWIIIAQQREIANYQNEI